MKHALLFLLFPLLCRAQISRITEEWKTDKSLKNASIGFCILNAKTSAVISEYNSTQALIPASTLKLVTTSAALGLLGSNYRYETKLAYTGTFDKKTGVIHGDLVITGSGDPTLQSENFYKDETVTDKWAKALKEKGVTKITGRLIADASCFERAVPPNWIWGDIGNYFGATPCGITYSDNKFKIKFTSKETGSLAQVKEVSPAYLTRTITVRSAVTAKGTEDEANVYGDPFAYTKDISGTIPPNKTNYEVEAALPDPARLCAESLHKSLALQNIFIDPNSIDSWYRRDSTFSTTSLYTHYSPTLEKIVFYTNMKSNNLYCETLLRTLGKGNVASGIDAVKNYWKQRGLTTDELFMSDGSGLSRANTITTALQANLLCKIYRDSINYKTMNASLPVSGKDPGMANIGKNTFIDNNMRAKTGYINRARGYCGYVKTKSGKELAFSVLFNNYNCSAKEAKLKLEKFLVELGEL